MDGKVKSSGTEGQLWAWKQLASNLEKKNVAKEEDYSRLKTKLQRRDKEYSELQEELEKASAKVAKLESQCSDKSDRVMQLCRMLESRKPDEKFEKLDVVTAKLKKAEAERERIKCENETLEKENIDLTAKLDESAAAVEKLQEERGKNNKLLLELSNIVRSLNCVTISYEKEAVEVVESTTHAHEQATKNIKRKIEAMEEHRHRLIAECQQLRDENEAKDAKIEALESYFHSVNGASSNSDVTSDAFSPSPGPSRNQTGPKSVTSLFTEGPNEADLSCQRKSAKNKPSRAYKSAGIALDDAVSCASSESSFSTLDPPEVPIEKFEAVKRDYEEALEKILSLSEELGEARLRLRALEQSASDQTDYIERCEHLENTNSEIQRELTRVERDLQAAHSRNEDLILEKREKELRYLAEIVQADQENQTLKEQLDSTKAQFSVELDNIEAEINISKESFESKHENLKLGHAQELEKLSQEYIDFKTKHSQAKDAQKKSFDDLKVKHDILVEEHTKLKEDFEALNEFKTTYSIAKDTQKKRFDDLKAKYDMLVEVHAKVERDFESLNEFKTTHALAQDTQKIRADDLKVEYNTLVEVHTKLKNDFAILLEKYDESLRKIVSLEDLLETASKESEMARSELKQASEDQSKPELAVMRHSADKSRTAMQEAVKQYQKVKREAHIAKTKYDNELKELRAAKELAERERDTLKQQSGAFGKDAETEGVTQETHAQLLRSYESALVKIDLLGTRLSKAGIRLDESSDSRVNEERRAPSYDELLPTPIEKISNLERVLDSDDEPLHVTRQPSKELVEHGEQDFGRDCEAIVHRIANRDLCPSNSTSMDTQEMTAKKNIGSPRRAQSQSGSDDGAWFYQLYHQSRLRCVHDSLQKSSLFETNRSHVSLAIDVSLWSAFLLHFRKLKTIHEALLSSSVEACQDPNTRGSGLQNALDLSTPTETTGLPPLLRDFINLQRLQKPLADKHTNSRNTSGHMDLVKRTENLYQVKDGSNTQSDELDSYSNGMTHDADVSIFQVLRRHARLHMVHYDLINNNDTKCRDVDGGSSLLWDASAGGLADYSSSTGFSYGPASPSRLFSNDEEESSTNIHTNTTNNNAAQKAATARLVIDGLRLELRRVKLSANATRIRHRAREKELRVVQLQYNKLQQEYNSKPTSDQAELAGEASVCHHQQQQEQVEGGDHGTDSPEADPTNAAGAEEGSVATLDYSSTSRASRTTAITTKTAPPSLPSRPLPPSVQESLSEDLREAERKVKKTARELELTKADADEAEQKQENQEKHLQDVIAQLERLESESMSLKSRLNSDSAPPTPTHGSVGVLSPGSKPSVVAAEVTNNYSTEGDNQNHDIFRRHGDRDIGKVDSGSVSLLSYEVSPRNFNHHHPHHQALASFDGSHLTSIYEPNTLSPIGFTSCRSPGFASPSRNDDNNNNYNNMRSPEGRDEKPATTQQLHYFEDAAYRLEYDTALKRISEMQRELEEAKGEAKRAKKKHAARERDLRDVIFQYKQLQNEYDELAEQYRKKGRETTTNEGEDEEGETIDELKDELVASLSRIATLQTELAEAKETSKDAQKRMKSTEHRLRQIVDEYKKLQAEHSMTVRSLENLKKNLAARDGLRDYSSSKTTTTTATKIDLPEIEKSQQSGKRSKNFLLSGKKKQRNNNIFHSSSPSPQRDDAASVSSTSSSQKSTSSSNFGKKLLRLGLGLRGPKSPSSKMKTN